MCSVQCFAMDENVECFKQKFGISTDIGDIKFVLLDVQPYNNTLQKGRQFGEKTCLVFNINCTVLNVNLTLKILAFNYENHAEVLKLEITIHNVLLAQEIAACKNFLQRKRNLNLTFEVLLKFITLFESRRLICQTVFEKQDSVIVTSEDDGISVKFCNQDFSIKYLELNWTVAWNLQNYEVSDSIEFYLNNKVAKQSNGKQIREKLKILVQPEVDFHSKLKLWKSLIQDIYGDNVMDFSDDVKTSPGTAILEISDSDDDVIEIDRSVCLESSGEDILIIE